MKWLVVSAVVVGLAACGEREEESVQVGLEEMGYTATIEDFHRAAEIGDLGAMSRLLDEGVQLDGLDIDGDTALHAASAAGSGSALVFLLEEGMDVDVRGAGGRTSLMAAAEANQVESLRQLLRAGAKAELVDERGYRALTLAADGGRTEAIEVLAVYSRDYLDDALLLASVRGHSAAAGMLADLGASVYARMDDGMTPLMLAAREGHEETVRVLLERGANRYAVDGQDLTAGQIASGAGHGTVAEILNRAPGAEEFTLPPLPELGDVKDERTSGALLGALAGAVLGGEEDAPPVAGAVIGGGEGAVIGRNEAGNAVAAVEGESNAAASIGAVVGEDATEHVGPRVGPRAGEGREGVSGREVGTGPPDDADDPEVVASGVMPDEQTASRDGGGQDQRPAPGGGVGPVPGLAMERYEEKALPLRVEGVEGKEARVRYLYGQNERVTVKEGEEIPLTGLRVVKVEQRRDHSKSTNGEWMDMSVVVVEDPGTGERRELVANLGASAQDPIAVLRGGAGPVVVRKGTVVTGSTGTRFKVLDVRPSQVVVEEEAGGKVHTLQLQKARN